MRTGDYSYVEGRYLPAAALTPAATPRRGLRGVLSTLPLILLSALALPACDNQNAIVLAIAPPAGVMLTQYAVTVEDRMSYDIVYQSGVQPIDAVAQGRDLNANPLKVGLKLPNNDMYLVHVRASADTLAPDGVTPNPRTPEYFFAGLATATGVVDLNATLLEVDPQYDQDFDHFPDATTWPAALPDAAAAYQGHPELLDCVDQDPSPGQPPLPIPYYAVQINPLAKPLCGLALDISCQPMAPVCRDKDGDGELENTDCDDNDPKRFHGNPRPRNCCQCTDRTSCATNHAQLADLSVCQNPQRCDDTFDWDCTGRVVPCFVDNDCDGFSPNDPVASLRDCDDTNPNVHPGAAKNCADPSHDWACDGAPTAGCTPCDLDGDGFQRMDAVNGCPSPGYTQPLDCNDNDRGVFPGSTTTQGVTLIQRDLKGEEGGGSVAAALRGLCRNTAPAFPTPQASELPQDADCDGNPRKGCPPATGTGGLPCDVDGDGFPNNNAGCNQQGLPVDCDDMDPHTFPGAPEKCGDGKAQSCGTDIPCTGDGDGDGYTVDYDCDDGNPNVHPWANESCNGIDDDCDGLVDEQNPDPSGNRLVATYTVGAKTYKGITSCTDNKLGDCGLASPTTGNYSGRCVCTAQLPGPHAPDPGRNACPGTVDTTALAPKCFGATQPALQTCVASQILGSSPPDQDCDGRIDAPDGKNLVEAGSPCGPAGVVGLCVAGTVAGCDKTKLNPFYNTNPPVSPAFDAERRFLTCNADATPPAPEICDKQDNNCNGQTDETCTEIAGATTPACCPVSMNPVCKDLNNDFNYCGSCTTQCTATTATQCSGGKCMCGASLACSGATPVCKATTKTCVQCMTDTDCNGVSGKPRCNTTTNQCVACLASTDCSAVPGKPVCKTTNNTCVACLANTDCTTAGASKCNTTNNTCGLCTVNSDCTQIAGEPLCNTSTGCVACLSNTDCKTAADSKCSAGVCVPCAATAMSSADCTQISGKPDCEMGVGCVSCIANSECSTPTTPICDTVTTYACQPCATNAQCNAKNSATPVCAGTGACVQCASNADCTSAAASKCNGSNACVQCTTTATNSADCTQITGSPDCKAGTGCVACLSSSECAAANPICDSGMNKCRMCANSPECQTLNVNTPICSAGMCGACAADADCAAAYPTTLPLCGSSGACVQCKMNSDCTVFSLTTCNMATGMCS